MGSKKPLNTGFVARRERGTDKYWVGSIPIQIVSKFTLFFSKAKKNTVGSLIVRSLGGRKFIKNIPTSEFKELSTISLKKNFGPNIPKKLNIKLDSDL